jgi:Flp pilus assembly protein TadD
VSEQALVVTGQARDALALARRAVYLAPGNWGLEQLAGAAAAGAGRCEEARDRLRRAAALAPAADGSGARALLARLRPGAGCGLGAS